MAILRLKEIRDMSSDQRIARVNEFRTELARLRDNGRSRRRQSITPPKYTNYVKLLLAC